jgi:hypothetical protein
MGVVFDLLEKSKLWTLLRSISIYCKMSNVFSCSCCFIIKLVVFIQIYQVVLLDLGVLVQHNAVSALGMLDRMLFSEFKHIRFPAYLYSFSSCGKLVSCASWSAERKGCFWCSSIWYLIWFQWEELARAYEWPTIIGEDLVKEGMVGDVVDPFFHPVVVLLAV